MLPKGAKPPVLKIKDIPAKKGEYAFLGHIVTRSRRDANDPSKVSQRGGKVYAKDNWFINLKIEDDTGEIGATINRFKAKEFEWLLEGDKGDLFFRGNIINEGDRKWIFIDKVLEIKPNERQTTDAGSDRQGNGHLGKVESTVTDREGGRPDGTSESADDVIGTTSQSDGTSGVHPAPGNHKKHRRVRNPTSTSKRRKMK
jgi:hypothetical protein